MARLACYCTISRAFACEEFGLRARFRGVRLKPFILKAVLTDSQFWVPVAVLALGIALLAFLH